LGTPARVALIAFITELTGSAAPILHHALVAMTPVRTALIALIAPSAQLAVSSRTLAVPAPIIPREALLSPLAASPQWHISWTAKIIRTNADRALIPLIAPRTVGEILPRTFSVPAPVVACETLTTVRTASAQRDSGRTAAIVDTGI
jgi:hypothetical protein